MKTFSLYQEYDISIYQSDKWEYGTHKHSFFELVYILEGSGTHILNNNAYEYQKGSLFLLTPEDFHSFDIQVYTTFCVITFNKIYFSKEQNQEHYFDSLFKKLEIIFYNSNSLKNTLIRKENEQKLVEVLVQNLLVELEEKKFFHTTIIQNSIFLLLTIIARNIQQNLSADFKTQKTTSEIGDIIAYIQQNIYKKENLKIEIIAEHFFKSKNYISQYFKAETGESLKEYISKYKINLVKTRLIHSNLTVTQIADELEYTDESHLNKTFKQFFGQTAKQFRIKHQQE